MAVTRAQALIDEVVDIMGSGPGGDELAGLRRVALLKRCEEQSGAEFRRALDEEFGAGDEEPAKAEVVRVVFESNLAGVEEFSAHWLQLIRRKMRRMTLCREAIIRALERLGDASGFDEFERELIVGCARISAAYDGYYLAYLAAVQEPAVVARLQARPPPAAAAACHCHYTVVQLAEAAPAGGGGGDGEYVAVPFAEHFADALAPVLAEFDRTLARLRACPAPASSGGAGGEQADTFPASLRSSASQRAAYVEFLAHYRACLALRASAEELEAQWAELDRVWMRCRCDIQVVHDIETGYGDPLRVKATPDFSLRFLDEEAYASENAQIADVQRRMEGWFRARDTPLARDGLGALANTQCGIYCIPFKTGMSLQFAFSGQSIPNRVAVKNELGVKIYFNAVETAIRAQQTIALVRECFADADEAVLPLYAPTAADMLVWHVAAHEVGHAIYNLKTVEQALADGAQVTLLEEPRAELTAMFTLRLLHRQGVLAEAALRKALAHFALDALRYFAKYESAPLRPYIIFHMYAYKTYKAHGYLVEQPATGQLALDHGQALQVLDAFADCFLGVLDAEDRADGAALGKVLAEMQAEDDFIRRVVRRVRDVGKA